MKVGGLSDTVEVVAEAALVDVKKRGTSANLTSRTSSTSRTRATPGAS
jgi:hypothetical protein